VWVAFKMNVGEKLYAHKQRSISPLAPCTARRGSLRFLKATCLSAG
jgi:hypothetical protein